MNKIYLACVLSLFSLSTLNGQSYQSYLDSALVMSEQADFSSAISLCKEAIQLDQTSVQAYFYKAGFHVAQISRRDAGADYQNYKAALADYGKVLELDKTHTDALFFRGGAHSAMGFLDSAMEDYKAALLINENQPKVLNSLAVCYARTGRPAEGLTQIDKAIDLDKNYAKAYSNRGNIYDMMRNNSKACENWKKAIELGYQGGASRYSAKCK